MYVLFLNSLKYTFCYIILQAKICHFQTEWLKIKCILELNPTAKIINQTKVGVGNLEVDQIKMGPIQIILFFVDQKRKKNLKMNASRSSSQVDHYNCKKDVH